VEDRKALRMAVSMGVECGVLVRSPGRRFGLAATDVELVEGVVHRHGKGFGWLLDSGVKGDGDPFIPPEQMEGLLHGDRVRARIEPGRGGKARAVVVKVIAPPPKTLGTVSREARHIYVRLEGVPTGFLVDHPPGGVADGTLVEVEVLQRESKTHRGTVRILNQLGPAGDLHAEVEKLVTLARVPGEFPPAILDHVQSLAQDPSRDAAMDALRRDIGHLPLVTIDGETAKDFDDAVCVQELPNGSLRLTVSIADVSHYVQEGTPLDTEAARRGTSIYLPGRVIPMLPPRLSDDLCSLRPHVPRLCMVVQMSFPRGGSVPHDVEFFSGVMRSRARLTYTRVAEGMAEHLRALPEANGFDLHAATLLFRTLRDGRLSRGALDLELPEPLVTLNEDGEPVGMRAAPRTDAHMLIEEFMIAANEAVARWFEAQQLPAVYRIHEPPNPEKLARFRTLAHAYAHGLDLGDSPTPAKLSAFLAQLRKQPGAAILQPVLLRSLMQARYAQNNLGHFGLASDAYLHFTSPIRRYPDLLVHRELRRALHDHHRGKKRTTQQHEERRLRLDELAEQSSQAERRATELERQVDALYAARFCQSHLGDSLQGVIAACADFGLFVQLPELSVEGLVPVQTLGHEYFELDSLGVRLVGRRSGRTFTLGDPVRVTLVGASLEKRQITLALAQNADSPRGGLTSPPAGDIPHLERKSAARASLAQWQQTRGKGSKGRDKPGRRSPKR
jgi:ribonuclease R